MQEVGPAVAVQVAQPGQVVTARPSPGDPAALPPEGAVAAVEEYRHALLAITAGGNLVHAPGREVRAAVAVQVGNRDLGGAAAPVVAAGPEGAIAVVQQHGDTAVAAAERDVRTAVAVQVGGSEREGKG